MVKQDELLKLIAISMALSLTLSLYLSDPVSRRKEREREERESARVDLANEARIGFGASKERNKEGSRGQRLQRLGL